MPLNLSASDRKLIGLGSAVIVLLLVIAAFVQPEEDLEDASPSTYSVKSGGAKATYTLLQEAGYSIERWQRPVKELPDNAEGMLLILASPEFPGTTSERKDGVKKFLDSGGTVLASGYTSSVFLPVDDAMPSWEGQFKKSWETFSAQAPNEITRAAPELVMSSRGSWYDLPAGGIPLYGKDRSVVALEYPSGKGRVIWLASSSPLSNAGLKVEANVKFLAAVLASVKPQKILWYEYAPSGRSSFHFGGPATVAIAAQSALLFMFALWSFARRSGPVRPAAQVSRLSPLEFVDALGGLYRQRRAGQTAVETAYRKFRAAANRKLGTPRNADTAQLARSIAARSGQPEGEITPVLQACESARYQQDLSGREAFELCAQLANLEETFSSKKQRENPR